MTGALVLAVARKELRQISRDRRTLVILLFLPAFFLLLFGYALNWDVRGVRIAVDDRDRSADSRALVDAFARSDYFALVTSLRDEAELVTLMDRNEIRAALIIPRGLSRDLALGHVVPVQVLLNGDNANTAATVMGYVTSVIRTESARRTVASPPGRAALPLSVEPRIWYNPQLRSALFLVPGLIAYIAMITAVVSTALSVVREKERGTVEQIRMAPLGTVPLLLGKTLPYFLISLAAELGIVVVAMSLFDVPMRGSWTLFFVALSLFLAGALGLGLFISSLADSQQLAFQIAVLASFLPTLMLSGFIFPIASMPSVLQVATYLVPARYFLTALRGIFLKGLGLEALWMDLAALAAYAVVVLGLASIRLRRQWS
jgi:ABC-2 type transport system permease protein